MASCSKGKWSGNCVARTFRRSRPQGAHLGRNSTCPSGPHRRLPVLCWFSNPAHSRHQEHDFRRRRHLPCCVDGSRQSLAANSAYLQTRSSDSGISSEGARPASRGRRRRGRHRRFHPEGHVIGTTPNCIRRVPLITKSIRQPSFEF